MFLDVLERRNPRLIEAVVALHQRGELPAPAFVIDLDVVAQNATTIAAEAERVGIEPLARIDHAGRGEPFLAALREGGIERTACVELACARATRAHGFTVGHLGRLVQVPRAEAAAAAATEPETWVVFSLEKAREAGRAAAEHGREQALVARIRAPGDRLELNEEGGFPALDVRRVAEELDWIEGARFAGITSFPALSFDPEEGRAVATRNLATLARAIEDLRRDGRTGVVVEAPGETAAESLATLADRGVTHAELGVALTGTTPMHAVRDLAERPAVLYLTEVSHHYAARAYCFGAGSYVDPLVTFADVGAPTGVAGALTGKEPSLERLGRARADLPESPAGDRYLQLDVEGDPPRAGESVVIGLRPEPPLVRPRVAGLRAVDSGRPAVAGIWAGAGEG